MNDEFIEKQETMLKEKMIEEESKRMQEEIKVVEEVLSDDTSIYTQGKKLIELLKVDIDTLDHEKLKKYTLKLRRIVKIQSNAILYRDGRIDSVLRRLGKLNGHIQKTIDMFREDKG